MYAELVDDLFERLNGARELAMFGHRGQKLISIGISG